ncbi:retrovirus-related pol polyprotein from transposon TNT 1-94 [Tanacetum coccineum]
MLDKDLYDSWKSRMELYMQNREHGRMILESVEHGPLIWPTVEDNGVIRTKKYVELSAAEKIQADCDIEAPISSSRKESLINDMNIYKMKMEQFQVNTKFLNSLPPEWSKFAVPVFSPGDDPIACLNKPMAFLTAVASSRFPTTNNQLRCSSNLRNQATIQDGGGNTKQVDKQELVNCYNCQGKGHMARKCTQPKRLRNATCYKEKAMFAELRKLDSIIGVEQLAFICWIRNSSKSNSAVIPHNAAFQTEDLDTYDYDCDDLSSAQAVLMANISNYGLTLSQRKARRIKPTLYDGAVISKTHVAMLVIDDEETLILEEVSRSNMFEKAKDPEVIAKKISHKPIDYEKLNCLIDDFETSFSPQQELSAEQAFWFHTFNPTIEPSYSPPVIVDVPSELPKVSLVNASLKKLKYYLTQFDSVLKKRTTPSALEEGEWGFEHTKAVFNNEIILFLKSLKDIFNVFDKDLLNEITKVQIVFDQMEVSV